MTKKELESVVFELKNENEMLIKVLENFGISIKCKEKVKSERNLRTYYKYLFQGNGKQYYGMFATDLGEE